MVKKGTVRHGEPRCDEACNESHKSQTGNPERFKRLPCVDRQVDGIQPVSPQVGGCSHMTSWSLFRAATGRADDQRLAQPVAQRLQPVERAGALISSLPVPRQAISAGDKLGERQALSGTSRQWR
jgi:hypothetical protein